MVLGELRMTVHKFQASNMMFLKNLRNKAVKLKKFRGLQYDKIIGMGSQSFKIILNVWICIVNFETIRMLQLRTPLIYPLM